MRSNLTIFYFLFCFFLFFAKYCIAFKNYQIKIQNNFSYPFFQWTKNLQKNYFPWNWYEEKTIPQTKPPKCFLIIFIKPLISLLGFFLVISISRDNIIQSFRVFLLSCTVKRVLQWVKRVIWVEQIYFILITNLRIFSSAW